MLANYGCQFVSIVFSIFIIIGLVFFYCIRKCLLGATKLKVKNHYPFHFKITHRKKKQKTNKLGNEVNLQIKTRAQFAIKIFQILT